MELKKVEIIESALKHFSDKGYYSTSVQDIAKDCGISKGSLYKYFDSKESLYISVFEYFQDAMFERATNIDVDSDLNGLQKLSKQIQIQMQDFVEKHEFILMQFKDLPINESKELRSLIKRTRIRMFNWQKECLINAFGTKVKPYIYDAVLILQGMMKEYLFLIIHERKHLPLERVACFLVDQIEVLINYWSDSKHDPLVQQKHMSGFQSELSKDDSLENIFQQLIQTISNMKMNQELKLELLATANQLKKEINKEKRQMFLIHALLSYLEKQAALKSYVNHINHLIEKVE